MRKVRRLSPEELAPYRLDLPPQTGAEPPAPLDLSAVFGDDRPVELEVGHGKGMFLVRTAEDNPGVNFVGVEIVPKYHYFAATRVAKRGLRNVRLVCGDGNAFVHRRVPPACFRAVHVYFPDPWWKNRHRKRRLFTEDFAAGCERVLVPGGVLHIATDVEEYFGVMTAVVAGRQAFRPVPPRPATAGSHDLDYMTNFERKARKRGMPIYRAAYEKPVPSG